MSECAMHGQRSAVSGIIVSQRPKPAASTSKALATSRHHARATAAGTGKLTVSSALLHPDCCAEMRAAERTAPRPAGCAIGLIQWA